MVTNKCARVEIHDFQVPTKETYLLVEISLENTGFVYLQYLFVCFVFCWFSLVCTGGISQISPSASKDSGLIEKWFDFNRFSIYSIYIIFCCCIFCDFVDSSSG